MDYSTAQVQLAQMERSLSDTVNTLSRIESALLRKAEAETILVRREARQYGGKWTGADEAEYLKILGGMVQTALPELSRLRRRAERQTAAISAMRRKHGIDELQPVVSSAGLTGLLALMLQEAELRAAPAPDALRARR